MELFALFDRALRAAILERVSDKKSWDEKSKNVDPGSTKNWNFRSSRNRERQIKGEGEG